MFRIGRGYWIFLLLVTGCQSYDQSANFTLVNRSGRQVYYYISCDSSFHDLELKNRNLLKPNESIKPYLLWGPEGEGPDKNSWVNAINRADDSALHVFYYYIDFADDPDLSDSVYRLVVRRSDYKADSLKKLNWRIEYN